MRELKFRAWDKEYKKMWWFDLMWGNTVAHGSGWIGMVDSPETEKHGVGILSDNRVQVDPIGKEIMQYTGLKDKNGKEIYEGDILGVIETEIVVEGSIEYVGAAFMLRAYNAFMEPMGVWILGNTNSNFLGYRNPSSFEIIGNIYENSELVKP